MEASKACEKGAKKAKSPVKTGLLKGKTESL